MAGTTVDSLFRKHGVPWDDEDEAKAAGERATTWDQRAFWREWSRPVVMVVPDLLPADLRALILSFVPPEPKPEPEEYDRARVRAVVARPPRVRGVYLR